MFQVVVLSFKSYSIYVYSSPCRAKVDSQLSQARQFELPISSCTHIYTAVLMKLEPLVPLNDLLVMHGDMWKAFKREIEWIHF